MRRDTGFSPEVQDIIDTRSGGRCEVCGEKLAAERHHRRARGAGGTRRDSTNTAANALHVCRDCHRLIESHRSLAMRLGWLVSQYMEPIQVPVIYRGVSVRLDEHGGVHERWAVA